MLTDHAHPAVEFHLAGKDTGKAIQMRDGKDKECEAFLFREKRYPNEVACRKSLDRFCREACRKLTDPQTKSPSQGLTWRFLQVGAWQA